MHTIRLANGTESSLLVFGCGGLGGSTSPRKAALLLDAAWDAGIRHFDVAPSYAFGEAEVILGKALARFGAQARVTTKVGIGAGPRPGKAKLLITAMARLALMAAPSLRKRLGKMRAGAMARGQFDTASLRASVESSLRALGRDHIDVLLLHEASAEDLSPTLMEELERLRTEGKIGEAGIGSRGATVQGLSFPLPPVLTCLQTEWRLGSDNTPAPQGLRVNRHGVMRGLAPLQALLAQHATLAGRIEALTGHPCRSDADLAALLMALARHEAPGGQIVVQSSRPERVRGFDGDVATVPAPEILALLREVA